MKTKVKRSIGLILVLIMIVALIAGCSPSNTTAPTTTGTPGTGVTTAPAEVKTLKIGVSDSLTGTAAPYGLPGANAVKMAAKQLNDEGGIKIGNDTYKIELVIYDNKSDAAESVSVIQKLMDVDKVQFVLGWSNSTSTLAAAKTIQNKEITMIVGNARSPELLLHSTGNVYRSATANYYSPLGDVTYIKEQGAKKVAILAFFNDTGYSLHVNNIIEFFPKVGVEIVAAETFNAGDTDLLSQMTKIASSGADALYLAGNIEESAIALRQLRELGSTMTMYTFSSGTGEQWLKICTNEQMTGNYTVRPQVADPGSEKDDDDIAFIDAYVKEFGITPSQTATNTYDNFWILMAALQRAGTTDWKTVNQAFRDLTFEELDERVILEYEPIDGKLFDWRGQAYTPYSALKWDPAAKNWAYETTIGKNLGADFLNDYLDKYKVEKGITTETSK